MPKYKVTSIIGSAGEDGTRYRQCEAISSVKASPMIYNCRTNQTYSVSAKTLIPAGATHLLAYGYADSEESSTPASVAISDLATGVLVLFGAAQTYSGNLGGRTGAAQFALRGSLQ